jgi:hypothetical protein
MIHPHTELKFISEQIGYGVVATRLIPQGTVTWVRDDLDQKFKYKEVERLPPVLRQMVDKYTFIDARGDFVLCWDLARFVNHDCQANCLSAGYEFEIAVRDILPGEELTDDYGLLNLVESFPCECGRAVCRRTIRPDDPVRLADRWDQALREAFPHVGRVEQPLWPLVKEKEKEQVQAALDNPARMVSCRRNLEPSLGRENGVKRVAAKR